MKPDEAAQIVAGGGLLIDTRPAELRRRDGVIPDAVVIDRNVLEWRLDPSSPHRDPVVHAGEVDRPIVIFCDEGYASSLAVESVRRLGLTRVADLVGGFQAWRATGLPVADQPAG